MEMASVAIVMVVLMFVCLGSNAAAQSFFCQALVKNDFAACTARGGSDCCSRVPEVLSVLGCNFCLNSEEGISEFLGKLPQPIQDCRETVLSAWRSCPQQNLTNCMERAVNGVRQCLGEDTASNCCRYVPHIFSGNKCNICDFSKTATSDAVKRIMPLIYYNSNCADAILDIYKKNSCS